MARRDRRIAWHKWWAAVMRLILLFGLTLPLPACSVVYSLRPEKAVRDRLESLPVPEGAILLTEHRGASFGSESSCTAAYTRRLYGSQHSFHDVVSFYQDSLPADEWAKTETLTDSVWFSSTGHFRLAVSSSATGSGAAPEIVDEARRTYRTLYYLGLTYMIDPICYQH
jgi:hypothetical protein